MSPFFHSSLASGYVKYYKCYLTCQLIISEVVRQKGLEHTAVDDLVAEITPKGRGELISTIDDRQDSKFEILLMDKSKLL